MVAGGEGRRPEARALERELEAVILEAKSKAAKIQELSGLLRSSIQRGGRHRCIY